MTHFHTYQNQFRINNACSVYNQSTQFQHGNNHQETIKQKNFKLQKSLQDSITIETKLLRSDMIEKLNQLQNNNKQLKVQYKDQQLIYKDILNQFELNEYIGLNKNLDVQIMNLKLNLKEIRQKIDIKNKEHWNMKQKINENEKEDEEITVLDLKIQQLSSLIMNKLQNQETNQQFDQGLVDIQDNNYKLKKEKIQLQQQNEKLLNDVQQLDKKEKQILKNCQQQTQELQNNIIQLKNQIKNFKLNSFQEKQRKMKQDQIKQINSQINQQINKQQQILKQDKQRKYEFIQKIINIKDSEYKQHIQIQMKDQDYQETKQIKKQLKDSQNSYIFNQEQNQENNQLIGNKQNFEREIDKNLRVYFNFVKQKLIKLNIKQQELYKYFDKIIEKENIDIFNIKNILKQCPFNFNNQYIIDDFSRKLLNNKLLENTQIIQQDKKIIIDKIIKLLGDYKYVDDKVQAQSNFMNYLNENIQNLVINYEFDNTIDPQELLCMLDNNEEHLHILMCEYIDMNPNEDSLKNLKLQKQVEFYKNKLQKNNRFKRQYLL